MSLIAKKRQLIDFHTVIGFIVAQKTFFLLRLNKHSTQNHFVMEK